MFAFFDLQKSSNGLLMKADDSSKAFSFCCKHILAKPTTLAMHFCRDRVYKDFICKTGDSSAIHNHAHFATGYYNAHRRRAAEFRFEMNASKDTSELAGWSFC